MKITKRCLSILLCVSLIVSMVTTSFAMDTIKMKNDARISDMLSAIDQQNFENASITAEQAKNYVSHYLFDSEFAAIGGGNFKYPNTASSYFTYITDGTYSQKIDGAKGCMAYSRYISQVFYGTDGENKNQTKRFKNYGEQKTADELKEFLKTYAQAGEHLRIYKWHSLSLVACDDKGFYALSYSGSNDNDYGGAKICLRYYTYTDFLKKYGKSRIDFYDANQNVNGAAPQCVHNYNSLGVCDKCGKSYPYTVSKSIFNVTLADKANVQSKPYGHSAYYKSTLPAGTTVAVAATTKNHYGNTWYQMTDGNWICSDRCRTFSQKADDKKPAVSISGEVSPSGTLKQGGNFGLRGTISTDCGKITSVTGSILDSSGNTVSGQSKTYTPNTTSFDIRTTINNSLIFNKLPAGSYTYYVKAVAKNGTQSAQWTMSRKFTVGAAEQCTHSYNSLGVCDKCGQAYVYTITKANFSVTIVDKAYVQSKPYGDSAYYKSTLSNGTTVSVTGTAKNHYGNTWYQMADGNWISSDRCKTVTQETSDQKPTISISGEVSPSGALTLGSNFGLRGVISTDCGVITDVNGYILNNASGNTVSGQHGYYAPNTASFDIRSTINNDLIFDNLSIGSYTYRVVVTAKNGTESNTRTISRSFTVEAPAGASYQTPTISVSGEVSPSGTLTQGSNFGLRGIISTDCGKITLCRGYILEVKDGDSVIKQRCEYMPNATSIDIRTTINNNLIFNDLPAGSYKYYVLVVAENGSESTTYYFSRPFNVA